MSGTFVDLRAALRERVHIANLLQARGVRVRLNGHGDGTALCPFHDDHPPWLSIYRSRLKRPTRQADGTMGPRRGRR